MPFLLFLTQSKMNCKSGEENFLRAHEEMALIIPPRFLDAPRQNGYNKKDV